nr:MAG TPA: hypothetical protein [Caudoviricetes sp.]
MRYITVASPFSSDFIKHITEISEFILFVS